MKAESGTRPNLFTIDKVGDTAIISLFDNVREVETQEDEVGIIFEYDYYSVEVPFREGLDLDVEYNFDKWLEFAREKEGFLPKITLEERVENTETKVVTLEETIDVLFGGVK